MRNISVIVPVFNEEQNIQSLHKEIIDVCLPISNNLEIIFIDDGSTDSTAKIIKNLNPVKLIRLKKNYGQTAAIDAGFHHAKNEYVITMDGDGQNDPADIPKLINHLENNKLDVVSGWRINRADKWSKRFISKGANFLRGIFIKDSIHDSGCTLKIYKRDCINELSLFGEMHRFIPALLQMRGFKIGEITVNHRKRKAGITKYNLSRTIKGFLDIIAVWFWKKYAVRPLHLLGSFGLLLIFLGIIGGIHSLIEYFKGQSMSDSALPVLTAFLLISGLQLFISGLMSDILSKIYYKRHDENSYFIHEIFETSLNSSNTNNKNELR